jgi:hypothetical protein
VSRELQNVIGYSVIGLGLAGFLLMAYAFGRLFRQAWRMSDRWKMVWKVVNIQPRRNQDWPNATKEADLIGCGAGIGLIFFLLLAAIVFLFRP